MCPVVAVLDWEGLTMNYLYLSTKDSQKSYSKNIFHHISYLLWGKK